MRVDSAELAQKHWNETPLYVSESERYSRYPWLFEVAEFRSHPRQRVLEVGCGTGCDLLQFAKYGAHATGIDITDEHLRLARQRVGNLAEVIKADARDLPFSNESFDYVYSHGVLHHSDEPERCAAEVVRVLRPGGRFNIHLYALWSKTALSGRLRYGKRWKLHIENSDSPVHLDLYSARRFQRLFPGCTMQFSKHDCSRLQFASSWFGWYIVGKGQKPNFQ
jgi:SAM-dependent methyltransferase